MKFFPLDVGVSEIRGIIDIIKDNGNAMEVSKLAEETDDEIDDLFPLLDAGVLLGLCKISKGNVVLTKKGVLLDQHNAKDIFSDALRHIEPFKSVLSLLKSKDKMSANEIADALLRRGISYNSDRITNEELISGLLTRWSITNHILSYDQESGLWEIYKRAANGQ